MWMTLHTKIHMKATKGIRGLLHVCRHAGVQGLVQIVDILAACEQQCNHYVTCLNQAFKQHVGKQISTKCPDSAGPDAGNNMHTNPQLQDALNSTSNCAPPSHHHGIQQHSDSGTSSHLPAVCASVLPLLPLSGPAPGKHSIVRITE